MADVEVIQNVDLKKPKKVKKKKEVDLQDIETEIVPADQPAQPANEQGYTDRTILDYCIL